VDSTYALVRRGEREVGSDGAKQSENVHDDEKTREGKRDSSNMRDRLDMGSGI